jgi:hypothetical protein
MATLVEICSDGLLELLKVNKFLIHFIEYNVTRKTVKSNRN